MDQKELQRLAAMGVEQEIKRLDDLLTQLKLMPVDKGHSNGGVQERRKRHMSKAMRAQISARMKTYWAAQRKAGSKSAR